MSFLSSFFGLHEFSVQTKLLIRNYVVVTIVYYIATSLSSTFLLLFYIQELGFKEASILITIRLFVQLLIDYPSGSLGDWIGQKWVLIIATISYGISFFFLFIAQDFFEFIASTVFFGIARAQESGAFSSWLDNNYKITENQDLDPERKNFGFTKSRLYTLLVLTLGVAYAIGGSLSSLTSRRFVFFVQIFLTSITMIIIYKLVKRAEHVDEQKEPLKFWETFKGGLTFIVSGKSISSFILGYTLFMTAWTIWLSLFLWPIYYSYTGSDALMSSIFSFSFFIGGAIEIITANLSKKVANKRFPLLILAHNGIYGVFALLLLFYPPSGATSFIMYLVVLFFEIFFNRLIWPIALAIYNRVVLDLIPSETRNGVYSLIPTLVSLLSIPLLLVFGDIIENHGLVLGLVLVYAIAVTGTVFLFISFKLLEKKEK